MLFSRVVIKKGEDDNCQSMLKLFVQLEIQGDYDGKGLDNLCGAIQAIKQGMETLRAGIQASEAAEGNTVIAEGTVATCHSEWSEESLVSHRGQSPTSDSSLRSE